MAEKSGVQDEVSDSEPSSSPYPPIDRRMLGERLKFARRHCGYESADTFASVLSERMGVTVGGTPIRGHSVRAIERGEQDASFAYVAAVVALTGVSHSWLLPALRADVADGWRKAKPLQ